MEDNLKVPPTRALSRSSCAQKIKHKSSQSPAQWQKRTYRLPASRVRRVLFSGKTAVEDFDGFRYGLTLTTTINQLTTRRLGLGRRRNNRSKLLILICPVTAADTELQKSWIRYTVSSKF